MLYSLRGWYKCTLGLICLHFSSSSWGVPAGAIGKSGSADEAGLVQQQSIQSQAYQV